MSKERIRLRYTGLIAFSSRIFSVITGLIFVVVVLRSVPSTDFGTWQYISILMSYIVFPVSGISYWATRDVARGEKRAAKTCLMLNMAVSLGGMALFASLSQLGAQFLNTNPLYFLIGSVTILAMTAIGSLEAAAHGCAPQISAYGFAAFEIVKVALGVAFILFLDMSLTGAFLAVLLAYIVQALILAFLLRSELKESFDSKLAVKWLKTIWLPVAGNFAPLLSSLDITIMTVLVKSTEPIAYLKTAQIIATTISYSAFMAAALYPRLLDGSGGQRDIETSLRLVMMAGLPMTAGAIVLAAPLLRIPQHGYSVSAPILAVLSVSTLINCLYSVMNSIIMGTERLDLDKGGLSFKKVFNSRLFFPTRVAYVTTTIYVLTTLGVSLYVVNAGMEPLSLQVPLAIVVVGFLVTAVSFAYTWAYAKKVQPFRFPLNSFLRQMAATAAMVVVLQLFYPRPYVAETLLVVLYGLLTYAAVMLLIDGEARALARAISKEVLTKLH